MSYNRELFKPNDVTRKIDDSVGLWARTEVLCSNGEVIQGKNGKSRFEVGAPFTISHNMVPVGGVQDVMKRVFGVDGEQFEIPTMYQQDGIGLPDSTPPTEKFLTPNGYQQVMYRYGNIVQLFGVGITGVDENDVTVYPVSYRDNGITMTKVNRDGLTVKGTLLPFRYTPEMLSEAERKQYFGKKSFEDGSTGYFMKRFESLPVIKHVWKTGEDVEDETLVTSDEIWTNASGYNPIESFTEIILKISRKDIKEWFINLEQEERTRINTIALFTGEYIKDVDDPADYGDYRDIRLFSKVCIPTEYLSLSKNLSVIYRIFGN